MNSRVKELRKALNLSCELFGQKIGVGKNAISRIETGKNGLTEQNIKLICQEFNVNEIWLRTGVGEMFAEMSKKEKVAKLVGKALREDDEFVQNVFIALGEMTVDEWNVVKKFVDKLKNL
ncbi:MAG: helix-turn-helix transcriptional regulator [Lachnospiraceae bacterium]|nr:helix-turn-helix transcriptional regulator [Lachnospiraceae bacterium]